MNCWFYRKGRVRFFSKRQEASHELQQSELWLDTRKNCCCPGQQLRTGTGAQRWWWNLHPEGFQNLTIQSLDQAGIVLRLTFTKQSGWTRDLERCLPVCSITGFPESFKTSMGMTSKNLMCVLFGCWMGFLIKTQFEFLFNFLSRAGIPLQTLKKISSVLEKKKTKVLRVWNKCSDSVKEQEIREKERERQNFRTSDLPPDMMKTCDSPKIQLEKLVECNSTAIDTRCQGSNLCMSLEVLGLSVLPEGQGSATDTLDPVSGWEGGLLPGLQLQNRTLELHHDKLWQTGWVTCEQHRHAIHRLPVSNVKDGKMQWQFYR